MTSRERALAALNHQDTDRVCIDFGATLATGISARVYDGAKKLLGFNTITTVEDVITQLAEIEPQVREAMGGDYVHLRRYAPSLGIPVTGYRDAVFANGVPCRQPLLFNPVSDGSGGLLIRGLPHHLDYVHPYRKGEPDNAYEENTIARCPAGQLAFMRMFHPLENVETIEQLSEYVFPEMKDEEYAFYQAEAKRLRATGKAIAGIFLGNIFEMGQLYWGYENFFVHMAGDPSFVHAYMEMRYACYMRDLEKYFEAVDGALDVIEFNDDLGTQQALLISPHMYRELLKPYHKKMFGYVREKHPDTKVFFHSCGAIFDIIPDLIDCGVQIINPVQISAAGMDPKKLKREYGKDVTFWGGGVDTQSVLCFATPDSVRAQVKEMLDIFSPGGGYVFS
jgi:uroporphyrinogen decarboxylase